MQTYDKNNTQFYADKLHKTLDLTLPLLYNAGMEIKPIAYAHTPFKEKFGIPRQSGRVPIRGSIVFEKEFRTPDAIRGIEGFSHLWLLFDFSLAHRDDFCPTVRPPRLGGNEKVGVFASRSPFRPNSIGLSCVRLVEVQHSQSDGDILIVEGIDLLDGTPIYDIKPYVPSDCKTDAVCAYANTHFYDRLDVVWDIKDITMSETQKAEITACIAEDPRPSYQDEGREYGMLFDNKNIKFYVSNAVAHIIQVEDIN